MGKAMVWSFHFLLFYSDTDTWLFYLTDFASLQLVGAGNCVRSLFSQWAFGMTKT